MATEPKTIPPAIFQKQAGGKKLALIATEIQGKALTEMAERQCQPFQYLPQF